MQLPKKPVLCLLFIVVLLAFVLCLLIGMCQLAHCIQSPASQPSGKIISSDNSAQDVLTFRTLWLVGDSSCLDTTVYITL